MTIGNRGLAGQPTLPYIDYRSYAGVDVFVDLTFLDFTGTPQIPSAVTYQVDDLTNAVNLIPATNVVPTFSQPFASTMRIQLPGSQMVMSRQYQGSQLCQLSVSATLPPAAGSVTVPLDPTIVLLLNGDSTPIVDSSNYNQPVTVLGNPPPFVETIQAKFGAGAIETPQTGNVNNSPNNDRLTVPIVPNGSMDITTSDFTIDFWAYFTSRGGRFISYGPADLTNENNGFYLQFGPGTTSDSTGVAWAASADGFSTLGFPTLNSAPILVNQWNYFAMVRKGAKAQVFWNGIINNAVANNWGTISLGATNPALIVGNINSAAGQLSTMYLDSLRIVKGLALYDPSATSITLPTAPVVPTVIPASSAPVVKSVTIIELCSIQTPGGGSP